MPRTLPPPSVPDADLVRRFVADRDEAAFELLVWRYRGLVAEVCRRVLGHAHDAEDAAQAAFLVLARKAAGVRGDALAPWLARVAYRCALRARRARKPHAPLPDLPAPPAPAPPDGLIDAELDRLPEKYRAALVLCYLQGLSYAEAGERLRCPTGTLCGWLTRGKALLRKRLARRGVAVPAAGLVAGLGGLRAGAAAAHRVREITVAAAAFAAGEAPPGPAAAIAQGVLNMVPLKKATLAAACGLLALLGGWAALPAAAPGKPDEPKLVVKADDKVAPKPAAAALDGVWLFDGYQMKNGNRLGEVWASVVTIFDGKFAITKVYEAEKPLTGTFTLDPAKKTIDLKPDEFDLTPAGMPVKLSACTLPGVYKLDGDTLTVAAEFQLGGRRPAGFEVKSARDAVLTLRRAAKDFKAVPKDVTVTVTGPDGKPAAGALVAATMQQQKRLDLTDKDGKPLTLDVLKATPEEVEKVLARLPDGEPLRAYVKGVVNLPPGTVRDKETGWTLHDTVAVATDGTVKVAFEKLRFAPVIVRDTERKLMGVASVTPWGLRTGAVTVRLRPECRVLVKGTCSEITAGGGKLSDHFNACIETADGAQIAYANSKAGDLEFLVPPGEYRLDVYGSEAMGRKRVAVTVPPDRSEYTAPAVDLPATGLHKLIGKPAPELTGVAGWKGTPVTLAGLKGKVVLLEFWGYWCGPCIGSMPVLFELHDKYKGDGLVVVGVHVDAGGEVDSATVLDEKLAEYKKDVWKGRDLPFPVALTSGMPKENDARGELADRYGIRGYPSTILIDRDGNVVGKFHALDAKSAAAELERVLKAGKK